MTADKAEVKFVSSLTELERRFSIPLQVIGRYIIDALKARWDRGEAPVGQFSAMGAHSKARPDDGLFWVPPGRPHPRGAGYVVTSTAGQFAGWSGYLSYADYCRLAYGGAGRDFREGGTFRQSVALRILSPVKAKIAPYGSHSSPAGERMSNTAVGYLASRFERLPLMHPSEGEMRVVGDIMHDEVVEQAMQAARIVNIGTDMNRKVRSLQKRAAKTRRALSL